jgi:transposase-like protein
VGRRSSLTPEVHARIVELLEEGLAIVVVCQLVGIGERTFYDWMSRGERALDQLEHEPLREDYTTAKAHKAAVAKWKKATSSESPFAQFSQDATRARARMEELANRTLRDALTADTLVVSRDGTVVGHEPDWGVRVKAAVEWAKRRVPDRWSDRLELEHGGEVAVGPRIPIEQLSPEAKRALDEAVELAGGDT